MSVWRRGMTLAARGLAMAAALISGLTGGVTLSVSPVAASSRHASMVIDANTGQVLHGQAIDEPRYPASLTKIMTLYLIFELIEQGRLTMGTRIRVSEEAASRPPSKLGLAAGSEIALGDLIRSLIVNSANDMSVAIAEHIAGSEANFARLMTLKARQIGMNATTFRNASGLPDPGQTTTARDMVTLALRIMDDFPRHYHFFGTRHFAFGRSFHRNHNTLLGTFSGTDGIKTGYTSASGFNLVSSVRRDGRHVVGAYFGGQTAASRNAHMKLLLTRALARASAEKTRRPVALVRRAVPKEPAVAQKAAPAPQVAAAPRPAVAKVAEAARSHPRARAEVVEPPSPPEGKGDGQGEVRKSPTHEIARVRRLVVVPRAPAGAVPDMPLPPAAKIAAAPAQPPAPALVEPPRPAVRPPHKAAPAAAGAAPSTFAEQAARLTRGEAAVAAGPQPAQQVVAEARRGALPPAHYLKGAAPNAAHAPANPAQSAGGVSVQVGAYASEAEARRQLALVKSRAGVVLANRAGLAQHTTAGARQLWRARFVGFDQPSAAAACTELRRLQIDCLVARTE